MRSSRPVRVRGLLVLDSRAAPATHDALHRSLEHLFLFHLELAAQCEVMKRAHSLVLVDIEACLVSACVTPVKAHLLGCRPHTMASTTMSSLTMPKLLASS